MKGKKICESLKAIRKSIAQANDIAYNPEECHHQGDCSGTCPACESELRYIERQLKLRTAMGKAAVVAGLTLGITSLSPTGAYAQSINNVTEESLKDLKIKDLAPDDKSAIVIRGILLDNKTKEPLIGAVVALSGTKYCTLTDRYGRFALRVSSGSVLEFKAVGYYYNVTSVNEANDNLLVSLEPEPKQQLRGKVPQVIRAEDIQEYYVVEGSKITREALMNLKVQDLAPDDNTAVVVRGIVISEEDKEPVIGATILLKGAKKGTATNLDGLFAVRVPVGSVLEIVYVGYETISVKVKEANDNLILVMKEDKNARIDGYIRIVDPPKASPADSDIYNPGN